jgi:hypothetical protein
MIGWKGRCEVHEQFTVEDIENVRRQFPDVMVLAHPECSPEVVEASDFSGSTSALIHRRPGSVRRALPPPHRVQHGRQHRGREPGEGDGPPLQRPLPPHERDHPPERPRLPPPRPLRSRRPRTHPHPRPPVHRADAGDFVRRPTPRRPQGRPPGGRKADPPEAARPTPRRPQGRPPGGRKADPPEAARPTPYRGRFCSTHPRWIERGSSTVTNESGAQWSTRRRILLTSARFATVYTTSTVPCRPCPENSVTP